eukprot:4210-Eustigmatos_ZCMA.PRE.1
MTCDAAGAQGSQVTECVLEAVGEAVPLPGQEDRQQLQQGCVEKAVCLKDKHAAPLHCPSG